MAFKLAQRKTFTQTVKVHMPNDKGTFDTHDFKATFSLPNLAELDELRAMPQPEVMRKVLLGYSDLKTESGEDVDFNEDNVAALLSIPQALSGLTEAFWGGLFKAREKN